MPNSIGLGINELGGDECRERIAVIAQDYLNNCRGGTDGSVDPARNVR